MWLPLGAMMGQFSCGHPRDADTDYCRICGRLDPPPFDERLLRGSYTPNAARRHHSKRDLPKEGTLIREVLHDLLRPHGLSAKEYACKYGRREAVLGHQIQHLRDDYGFDIRLFRDQKRRYHTGRYRVVGRVTDQGYVDFVASQMANDRLR